MSGVSLERSIVRAFLFSFSRRGVGVAALPLLFLSLLTLSFRSVSLEASVWMGRVFPFLAFFFAMGLLLPLGVLIVRTYRSTLQGERLSISTLLVAAQGGMIQSLLCVFPLLMAALCLWMLLALFWLLTSVPVVGLLISLFLASVPFLLVLSFFFLIVAALLLLFFAPAPFALGQKGGWSFITHLLYLLRPRPFFALALFGIGMAPGLLVTWGLYGALLWTQYAFSLEEGYRLLIPLQEFFLLVPALLLWLPALRFFFHFGWESVALLKGEPLISP